MIDSFTDIQELIDQGRINKAEILIAQLLRQTNLDEYGLAMILSYRAQTYLLTARPERALNDLNTIKGTNSNVYALPHVQRLIADSYFALFELSQVGFARSQDLKSAYGIYDMLMRLHPSYREITWIHYQLGRILLIWNRSDEATEHFERVVSTKLYADNSLKIYAFERLAFIAFYDERNPTKALNYISTLPSDIENIDIEWIIQLKLLHSRILFAVNELTKARDLLSEIYTRVYQNRNNGSLFADTLLNIAEQLRRIPDQERYVLKYLSQFTQVTRPPIGINVTWGRVYEMIGDAHLGLNQFDSAIEAYEEGLRFNPHTPWFASINYRIAKAYYFKGNFQRVIATVNSVIADVSDDALSYLLYDLQGSAHFAMRDYERAQNAFQIALLNVPDGTSIKEKIQLYYRYSTELLSG